MRHDTTLVTWYQGATIVMGVDYKSSKLMGTSTGVTLTVLFSKRLAFFSDAAERCPVRYCSITSEASGAARSAPKPPFSTYTLTAIRGLFMGAKPIKIEWSWPSFSAVPVFPQMA